MNLEEYLDKFFGEIMTKEGIDKVKSIVKEDMKDLVFDYETTKVECQVYTEENNYDPRVEITSDNYSDGEVIFLDFHVDEELK